MVDGRALPEICELWMMECDNAKDRNRNLKISKALLKSQVHQGTSLFTSAATNQRGFSKGDQEKLRSDFQNTRRGQSSC
ncbi:MAG: hypothetical protein CRN43_18835 [Candidatus Nephrothrix sp. EaCA]|nr:MAG: hypothetical protein CRN43_18835 [Candidatus Nephrothrix sp. EaCA]